MFWTLTWKASDYGLLWMYYGQLYGTVACHFGLLGFSSRLLLDGNSLTQSIPLPANAVSCGHLERSRRGWWGGVV